MASQAFGTQLARYGPDSSHAGTLSVRDARRYCRQLARCHYENFTVASWMLPHQVRQHFCNIYAYCRWADDLADETGDRALSLDLLDWWQDELNECFAGRATHPVFVALRDTIDEFSIPQTPLADLLAAFRQDQHQTRYQTLDDLLDYCRHSANPVGHLVLYLGRCHDEQRGELSDSICTGLQLANFCQDIARDYGQGRIYIPIEVCQTFACGEEEFAAARSSEAFRRMLASEVDRAERFLHAGSPLVELVPRWLQIDLDLYVRGGLAILQAIRDIRYDVLSRRPAIGRWTKLRLLLSTWWRRRGG